MGGKGLLWLMFCTAQMLLLLLMRSSSAATLFSPVLTFQPEKGNTRNQEVLYSIFV